jgi:DNA-binding transcriptional LysR family regulator
VRLFHRAGRGLRLSTAGEALIGPARQIQRAIHEARNVITGVLELRTGTVQIAALATLAVDPMASLIARFRARHPDVEVQVFEPDSADQVSALVREGSCELGAAHLPVRRDQLIAETLGEQELRFVLPSGTPAHPRAIGPRELAGTPFVVSPPGTSTRMLLEQALAAVGVAPQIAVETAAREAIIPLVLAGAGAALLPATLAMEAQRRGATVRSARPPITRTVGLIHRHGPLSPAAGAFLELASAAGPFS